MPNTLHFCWLLDQWRPSRERYLAAWRDAGWDCVLWHGGQLTEAPIAGIRLEQADDIIESTRIQKAYAAEASLGHHAACADLFRYQVLYLLGGAYSDIDILPDSGSVPGMAYPHPMFGKPNPAHLHLETRFIVSESHHELMRRLIDTALDNESAFIRSNFRIGAPIIYRTGPQMAVVEIARYAQENHLDLSDFIIQNATLDDTPENINEHHADSMRARFLGKIERESGIQHARR